MGGRTLETAYLSATPTITPRQTRTQALILHSKVKMELPMTPEITEGVPSETRPPVLMGMTVQAVYSRKAPSDTLVATLMISETLTTTLAHFQATLHLHPGQETRPPVLAEMPVQAVYSRKAPHLQRHASSPANMVASDARFWQHLPRERAASFTARITPPRLPLVSKGAGASNDRIGRPFR